MNGGWAIFQHEVKTRWQVLAAAAFATLIPLVVPILPGVFAASAADIRGGLAWGVALGLAWLMAVVCGATMIASELSQGRASFLLARPVSTPAIWIGKLGACLFVVVVCELMVLFPAAVLPGREGYFDFANEPWWAMPLLLVGLPLFLILITHAVSIMSRARSAWLVVDAASLLIVVSCAWSLFWSWTPETVELGVAGLAVLLAAFTLFLFLAGGAQVIWGRGDLRRSHRVLSLVLWSGTLATISVLAGLSAWIRAVPPTEITYVRGVTTGGGGKWIALGGTSGRCKWHRPNYLFNLDSGAWMPIRLGYQFLGTEVVFSQDGRRVLWAAPAGDTELELMVAELGGAGPVVRETGLIFPSWISYTLSPDGSRAAVVANEDTLSVYDLTNNALVAALKMAEKSFVTRISFPDRDHVRLALFDRKHHGVAGIRLEEFSVPEKRLHNLLHLEEGFDWSYPRWSPSLDRLLAAEDEPSDQREWMLFDVEHEPNQPVPLAPGHRSASFAFLSQRRVALAQIDSNQGEVVVYSGAGEVLHRIALGSCTRLKLGAEVRPGELIVGVRRGGGQFDPDVEGFTSFLLELGSGEMYALAGAGYPVASSYVHSGEHLRGALVNRLFFADSRTLQLWDPESDELRVILKTEG